MDSDPATRWQVMQDVLGASAETDERMQEAIEIVASKRDKSGRWALGIMHPDELIAEPGVPEGQPSRWNTLRALRVLDWYSTLSQ